MASRRRITEVVQKVDEGLAKGRKLAEGRNQGGADGGRNQGGTKGGRIHDRVVRRSSQPGIQSPARMTAHGGVDGGRSHAEGLARRDHGDDGQRWSRW